MTVWRSWGQGSPLVLLHGGHGSWMHWARNIEHLALQFQVWVPDMPGFGESGDFLLPPHDPERSTHIVECLRACIERLTQGRALNLAGFSFGGAIACALASQLPTLQRLALVGCGGHGSARRDKQALLDWRRCTGEAQVQALRQNLGAFMLHDDHAVDDVALYIHAQSCRQTRFRSKEMSRSDMALRALSQVGVPIRLLWGEEDVTAVPDHMAPMFEQGRHNRITTLVAGAGHWLQWERSDVVNAAFSDWFTAG